MARGEILRFLMEIQAQGLNVINDVRGKFASMEGDLKRTATATEGLQGSFTSLNRVLGLFGVALSGAAIGAFVKSAVAASVESEKATNRLSQTVNQLGISYALYETQIQSAIKATSQYAVVQDEEVSDVLQKLILQTGNLNVSIQSLNNVFDLARAANIDVAQAAQLYTKGLLGQIDRMSLILPGIKEYSKALGENAKDSEKAAVFLKFFDERIKGALTSIGEQEKAVRTISVAWKEFGESMGRALSPVIIPTLDSISNFLKNIGKDLTAIHNNFAGIKGEARGLDAELERIRSAAGKGVDIFAPLPGPSKLPLDRTAEIKEAEKFERDEKRRTADFVRKLGEEEQADREKRNVNLLANAKFEQSLRDELNQNLIENAKFNAEVQLKTLQNELTVRENYAATVVSITNALYAFSGSKSKALFALSKAAAFAQAIISAHVAYALALATPPGPPYTIPLAQSVLSLGYANAAIIAATAIGGAFGGRGVGGGGGGTISGNISSFSAETGQGTRTTIFNITFNSTVTDRSTLDRLANDLLPSLGSMIQDKGGSAGPIQITYNRP